MNYIYSYLISRLLIIILPKNMPNLPQLLVLALLVLATFTQTCSTSQDPSLLLQAGSTSLIQATSRSLILTLAAPHQQADCTPTLSISTMWSLPLASRLPHVTRILFSHTKLQLQQPVQQCLGLFSERRRWSYLLICSDRCFYH